MSTRKPKVGELWRTSGGWFCIITKDFYSDEVKLFFLYSSTSKMSGDGPDVRNLNQLGNGATFICEIDWHHIDQSITELIKD